MIGFVANGAVADISIAGAQPPALVKSKSKKPNRATAKYLLLAHP
jgi:hypothetical protein